MSFLPSFVQLACLLACLLSCRLVQLRALVHLLTISITNFDRHSTRATVRYSTIDGGLLMNANILCFIMLAAMTMMMMMAWGAWHSALHSLPRLHRNASLTHHHGGDAASRRSELACSRQRAVGRVVTDGADGLGALSIPSMAGRSVSDARVRREFVRSAAGRGRGIDRALVLGERSRGTRALRSHQGRLLRVQADHRHAAGLSASQQDHRGAQEVCDRRVRELSDRGRARGTCACARHTALDTHEY